MEQTISTLQTLCEHPKSLSSTCAEEPQLRPCYEFYREPLSRQSRSLNERL